MTDKEVIANLAKENLELKDKVAAQRKALEDIVSSLVCVGGPLNDNVLEFDKEQCKFLWNIKILAEKENESVWFLCKKCGFGVKFPPNFDPTYLRCRCGEITIRKSTKSGKGVRRGNEKDKTPEVL